LSDLRNMVEEANNISKGGEQLMDEENKEVIPEENSLIAEEEPVAEFEEQ